MRSHGTSDPPLSEAGREQAHRVGERLAEERIDAVFASNMRRAIETAEPYAALAGHAVTTRSGIAEFDRHTGAYTPLEELKRENYEAWKTHVEGRGGADIDAFQTIVVETLEEIVQSNAGRNVAVFCHGGVINVWTAHVLGMPVRLFFEPKYASLHRYLCARTGERNIVGLNDVAHLRELSSARG